MSFFCTIDKSTTGTTFRNATATVRALTLQVYSYHTTLLPPPSQRVFVERRSCAGSLTFRAYKHDHARVGVDAAVLRCEAGRVRGGYSGSWNGKLAHCHSRNWSHPFASKPVYLVDLEENSNIQTNSKSTENSGVPAPISSKPLPVVTTSSEAFNDISKEDLHALVDQYHGFFTQYDGIKTNDRMPLYDQEPPDYPARVPSLDYSKEYNVKLDADGYTEWPEKPYVWPAIGEAEKNKRHLLEAISDMDVESTHIYHLYRQLPAPRIPYLHWEERVALLKRLGIIEQRDEASMLRYMSVLDDIKSCGITIPAWQYNIAMSFSAACVTRISDIEVHAGLKIWREMESLPTSQSNQATFDILFTTAAKAGRFTLAEKIHKEMRFRGLELTRYHHVSLIYYHALQGDGIGLRQAYKDLVDANEIVDTTVLNCLITSFIKVGEPSSADQVYTRMKDMHAKRSHKRLPPRTFHTRRKSDKILLRMTQFAKADPHRLESLQNNSIVAPNARTYQTLICHFAETTGDFDKVVGLLDDMHEYNVEIKGQIFLSLFKAFGKHGGVPYSRWTVERLELVWTAFEDAIEERVDGIYVSRWIVVFAIKAFEKCVGPDRALECWEAVKDIWKTEGENEEAWEHVLGVVGDVSGRVGKGQRSGVFER